MKGFSFLFLFLLLSITLFGQNCVEGVVIDSLTREPVSFSTVYLSGTTKGTITDENGHFELKEVTYPSTIVFSSVGYKPKNGFVVNDVSGMLIELSPNNELPEIEVVGKGEREANLAFFKRMFLGDDRWGRKAVIKNENVLLFEKHSSSRLLSINDGPVFSEEVTTFMAVANEPLIVDLPELGYKLHVDLIKFTTQMIGDETQCNILGYFYYQPYDTDKKSKIKKIGKNRRAAYYNSSQHFLRSCYDNSLEKNGYRLLVSDKRFANPFSGMKRYDPAKIKDYSIYEGENEMKIIGLNDKKVKIQYFQKKDGSPLDLNKNDSPLQSALSSEVFFLQDTCTFLKNGIIPDNNIVFMGSISEKRVGACLPDDYMIHE